MDDLGNPRPSSHWPLLLGALVVAGLIGAGAYFGFSAFQDLSLEASKAESLKSQIAEIRGQGQGLDQEVARLSKALAEATAERDRLKDEVAACGEGGCAALKQKLAAVEGERDQLRERVSDLEKANGELQAKVEGEISRQTGVKTNLVAVLRIGPFPIGSFKLGDDKLAEVVEALKPYKDTPLLVVGVADASPYKGASSELKQLGLMLARARLVKEMGYEVYYQVRQNDPSVPQSRGIIVYKFSLEAAPEKVAQGRSLPLPTFYTSTERQAG